MKLTIKTKILPNFSQKISLLNTIEIFNEACNYVSNIAFERKIFGQIALHKLCYYEIRKRFKLSSQFAVRVIGKVSDTYKTDKKRLHKFRKRNAIVYDRRILTIKGLDFVSILSLDGRLKMSMIVGSYAKLDRRMVCGQAELVYQDKKFYLCLVVEIPEPVEYNTDKFLGIDLGIVNIAYDSDGKKFSGNHVNNLRSRNEKLRRRLNKKGTKSAKRLLKKRRCKESRFSHNVNHIISKKIVMKAKDTFRGIALEKLKGIRERITVRKSQRRQQNSWSFYDLQKKILYKAKLAGVPVRFVDERNTSRTCPECGCVSKENRKSQYSFSCILCGFASAADYVAACIIASRAAVNQPYVANSFRI